jgi:hypothetical protein
MEMDGFPARLSRLLPRFEAAPEFRHDDGAARFAQLNHGSLIAGRGVCSGPREKRMVRRR